MRVPFVLLTAFIVGGLNLDAIASDRPVVPTSEAAQHSGTTVTVVGKVVEVRRVANGPVMFEMDGAPAKPAFRALIFPMAVQRFGSDPEMRYLGKVVEVTGSVMIRGNLPQLWINDPTHIRLAPEKGTATPPAPSPTPR